MRNVEGLAGPGDWWAGGERSAGSHDPSLWGPARAQTVKLNNRLRLVAFKRTF